MAEKKVKRTTTKHKNIYYNESTRMYDVKYNYTEYDVATQKNRYKSKWVYSIPTISQAKSVLADLVSGGIKEKDAELTLDGAFELWKKSAAQRGLSQITVRNTTQHYHVIARYIPKETKLRNLTEDIYLDMMVAAKAEGYSEESLHSINATFRKLVNLSYKKGLLSTNFLDKSDNFKTRTKTEYRLVTQDEYEMLDAYFARGGFVRKGTDNFKEYRCLISILYYCGLRIGEALALTYNDIEVFDYHSKKDPQGIWVYVSERDTKQQHLRGKRLIINKSYATKTGQIKDTKNKKDRKVPITPAVDYRLGHLNKSFEYQTNPSARTQRMFPWTDGAVNQTLAKACERLGISSRISCHDFRHTFISNLICRGVPLPVIEKVSGDTQETILKRYSHMFEQDEKLVLDALSDL